MPINPLSPLKKLMNTLPQSARMNWIKQ